MKKERTILSFSFLPIKTKQGWVWLRPYFKKQKWGKRWIVGPDIGGFETDDWVTKEKTIVI